MMEELAAFGALCLIALIVYFILVSMNAKDKKDKDNIDLAQHLDKSIGMSNPVDSYEGKKELRKILSDPDIREEAEARRLKYREQKQKEDDLKRKDIIIKRTFSYKYENVIYEIFAPYAIKKKYELDGQKWEYPIYVRLENSFVISEISRLLCLETDESNELFWNFEKNDMIDIDSKYIADGTVLGKWVKSDRCALGSLLIYDWNIISNEDMNLSKWIEQHPNRETKDSVDQRRGVIKETISFNEYVRREGGYTVRYNSPYVEVKVNNGKTLHLADSQIGMPPTSYKYRLNEFIETISDKLFVVIDDDRHTLRLDN